MNYKPVSEEEKKFLEEYDQTIYKQPSVTTDMVIFRFTDTLEVLLIKRGDYPYKGYYAFPGGFCQDGESAEETAKRELQEETGVKNAYLEQLYFMSTPERDPRGWIMTSVYMGFVPEKTEVIAGDDASEAMWFSVKRLGEALKKGQMTLAFDHNDIFAMAVSRLRNKVEYTNIAFELLPKRFTLPRVQQVYEDILQRKLTVSNFRTQVLRRLVKTNAVEENKFGRPAVLYKLNKKVAVDAKTTHPELNELF